MADELVLWDERRPCPSIGDLRYPDGAVDVLVHRADEQYRFLHDNAVVWHGGTLFAAWYNCPQGEMEGASAIRGRRSADGGRTWSVAETIACDEKGSGVLYVPVAFLSHGGVLYAFVSNMVGADLVTRCEVFVLDEANSRWSSRGFIAGPFLPNAAPVRMPDGNFIMAGRMAETAAAKPEIPAVAISDGENLTREWTVIPMMTGGTWPFDPFPESTVWVEGREVTALVRGGGGFVSRDCGLTWKGPFRHNLPAESTKLYAGILSTGQRYAIWNRPDPQSCRRNLLVMAVSQPGRKQLVAMWKLRHGYSQDLQAGPEWSYPCAVEHDGKLYVIYTSEKKHSVMTILPVRALGTPGA